MNVHGWLHLWITGLQGPQAKPFKARHDFAAANVSRLPKVPRVGEPPVQLGQLLQHVHQQAEAGSLLQVESPAGRQDLLQKSTGLGGVWASGE